ncbi:MAG TPA: protein kinase [Thermoanaerobaculia bacterium]|jgi:serine/threonine protein kinase/Tol biopolymer transport system component
MRLVPGSSVGPYEISGAIGAGGMGEVYRARDTRLGREVAVKVLPREFAADPDHLARFEREARSSSALNHPNIVTIHDFAVADSDCYLVMELVRGESLRQLLTRGPLPLNRLLTIAGGIADGLAAAHAAGLIHRDLKPENVMVTAETTAKILDFGLAKASPALSGDAPTEARMTGTGVVLGTLPYMSPEQARGETLTTASDQFSFGLVLYEMAAGKHPFRRQNLYETVSAIIRDEPPPLDEGVPEPLGWIIERCLEKEPSKRYGSTDDLARDLAAVRGRLSTRKSSPAAAKPPRLSLLLVILAVAALAGVAASGFLLQRHGFGRGGPSREPVHVHLAMGELQPHYAEVAVPVALSPNGRFLITQGSGARGASELWMTDLRTGAMRSIAEDGFGPAWSHDGRFIAFFADGKLKTMAAEGGPARVVCDAAPEGTPAYHGDTILFARYSAGAAVPGLYRVDVTGGTPKLLVPATRDSKRSTLAWWPQFLPDGKRFLYMTLVGGDRRIAHEVMLGSLDGSPPKRIAALDSRAVYAAGHLLFVRDGTLLAQPFDPDEAQLTGEAKPLVDDLHYFRSTGMAAFAVSEEGRLVWRSARRPTRLAWLDRNGAEVASIATANFDVDGRLSADGSRYAVGVTDPKQGVGDIWIYNLERGNSQRATFDLLDQKAPVWAADGRTLYYRTDGNDGPPDIFALKGAAEARPLHAGPSVEHPEDVSRDGHWLLFTTYVAGSSDIQLLPLTSTGRPRAFAATPLNERSPRFSPDGRRVAYASNVSGQSEVYVSPVEDSGAAVRVSQHGGAMPRWSRDGTELFFFQPGGRLLSVSAGEKLGAPRVLFHAPKAVSFEPSPDGTRFLVQMQEQTGQPEIQLLINWTALLEPARE